MLNCDSSSLMLSKENQQPLYRCLAFAVNDCEPVCHGAVGHEFNARSEQSQSLRDDSTRNYRHTSELAEEGHGVASSNMVKVVKTTVTLLTGSSCG